MEQTLQAIRMLSPIHKAVLDARGNSGLPQELTLAAALVTDIMDKPTIADEMRLIALTTFCDAIHTFSQYHDINNTIILALQRAERDIDIAIAMLAFANDTKRNKSGNVH